jgi:hypothetical protein
VRLSFGNGKGSQTMNDIFGGDNPMKNRRFPLKKLQGLTSCEVTSAGVSEV